MCFSRLPESWDKADGAERLPRRWPHASFIWTNVIEEYQEGNWTNVIEEYQEKLPRKEATS